MTRATIAYGGRLSHSSPGWGIFVRTIGIYGLYPRGRLKTRKASIKRHFPQFRCRLPGYGRGGGQGLPQATAGPGPSGFHRLYPVPARVSRPTVLSGGGEAPGPAAPPQDEEEESDVREAQQQENRVPRRQRGGRAGRARRARQGR